MAQLHKFNRLLVVHGIDPTKANVLRIEQKPEISEIVVYVEYNGVQYRIDNKSKQIINSEQIPEIILTPTKNDIKKPRGWHFREVFVDSEGNVYHKGIEQPNLKGTLPIE